LASPINFFELVSRLSERTFEERKKAAKAVIQYADKILDDPESYLAQIWRINIEPFEMDWRDGFKAVADAVDINQLQSGVPDFREKKIRGLRIDLTKKAMEYFRESWVLDIENAIEEVIPSYSERRKLNKMRYLYSEEKSKFIEFISSPEILKKVVIATWSRIAENNILPSPTPHEIKKAGQNLRAYIKAYCGYLIKVATEFAPRPNDRADLEFFIYIQKDRKLFTYDKKWIQIAKEAGLSHILFYH